MYHPPSYDYSETDLIDFLANSCESLLSSVPNARVIIAGDVNQLNLTSLRQQTGLSQLVKNPTRKDKILDVFLTNTPNIFGNVCNAKCLVQTDHCSIMISPKERTPPIRTTANFIDARDQHMRIMLAKLEKVDWSPVLTECDVDRATDMFYDLLLSTFNESFPVKEVKMSTKDPPYMSPLLKYLLRKRNKLLRKGLIAEAEIIPDKIPQLIKENQQNMVQTSSTLMIKYADDITCSIPVIPTDANSSNAVDEVENIKVWALQNKMSLNLDKTN